MSTLSTYKTTITTDDQGVTRVKYRDTNIVNFHNKGFYLSTDGHKTATTKKKMNQASVDFDLGFKVYQRKNEWFVEWRNETYPFNTNDFLAFYEDGQKPLVGSF